jgi:hypothetical protein
MSISAKKTIRKFLYIILNFIVVLAVRPLQNVTFCPISTSSSNFNPRNTQCIPVVKIIAFLELEQKSTFFKGLAVFSGTVDLGFYDQRNGNGD